MNARRRRHTVPAVALVLLGALLSTAHCTPYTNMSDTADADTTPPAPVDAATDGDAGQADAGVVPEGGSVDADGTAYPLDPSVGAHDGDFSNLDAAFDGIVAQSAADSARMDTTQMPGGLEGEGPVLYREFACQLTLRRVEVYAPTDSFFLYDATNYPTGGNGRIELLGRRADSPQWFELASRPFTTNSPLVFDPNAIGNVDEFVAYGVRFVPDDALPGTLQVAEVRMFGYCASPPATLEWATSEWTCAGVDCVAAHNTSNLRRSVTCTRSTGGTAHPALCPPPAPETSGAPCDFSCGYSLVYVGARAFTYSNDSGWLHEGSATSRAGPLPSDVDMGTTRAAIEGKPCSIPTSNPETYFVGISCREDSLYCAFRCE